MIVAYIRISTNKQDLKVQKLEILDFCQKNKMIVDSYIEIEESSRVSVKKRKIDELKEILKENDILIATELSRLGRSMMEVMNLVCELSNKGIKLILLRQPELSSFKNPYQKLILSFWAYMAETERDFISQRTKAGLEKAKKAGKRLGRPVGSFNSIYCENINEIRELHKKGLPPLSIYKLLKNKGSYSNFTYFFYKRIKNDKGKKRD